MDKLRGLTMVAWMLLVSWILMVILMVTIAVDEPVVKYVEVPRAIDVVEVKTPYPVFQEVPVYVGVIVEVPVEVIKEVPIELREFESVEVLEEWYMDNQAPLRFTDKADFNNPEYETGLDCDDYATYLRDRAHAQGYLMSLQIVEAGTHMINMVMIGNDIFYLEPDPRVDYKIWKVAERD